MAKHNNDQTERLIAEYCTKIGITRAQYDLEWLLDETQLAALEQLHAEVDAAVIESDVIVPDGLPGAGKRYGDLSEQEQELLSVLEPEAEALDHEPLDP
jgi:hypothetical protein